MSNEMDKEFYIFGEPVDTELGQVRFLTYKESLINNMELSMIAMDTLHIYYQYRKMFDEKDKKAMQAIEALKSESLYDIIQEAGNFKNAYLKVFELVMESDEMVVKAMSSKESFMHYRRLVMDMQILVEQEVSPHPEIQEGIERSRTVKSASGEPQTPTDIITSIVAATPNSFEDVCGMTVYQVYAVFYRLGALKSYDTETLFATVSNDIKISSWSRNIDLFKKEDSNSSIKRSEFEDKTRELF